MGPSTAHDQQPAGVDPRIIRTRNDVLEAALVVLVDQGWDAVTQPNVARAAGYSKGTVYTHWPDRLDLVRDAFARYDEAHHHEPTGDLRVDLVGELTTFRAALADHQLARILAILAERAGSVPAVVELRDVFVAEGERPIRERLSTVAQGPQLEAVTLMLLGMVVDAALLHGSPPDDATIEAAVDLVLQGLAHAPR